jgi:DNA-binding transcriptional ArsR family regulator
MPTIPVLQPAAPSTSGPDYELDEYVEASTPTQLKAIGHRTRATILDMVLERAATTTELARALGQPKGTVGHHLKVLEAAGLVRVVATRQVRALTAKYYGRTGRTIVIKGDFLGAGYRFPMLSKALGEATEAMDASVVGDEDALPTFTLRHARLSEAAASAFAERLHALAVEFSELPRGGDRVYGLIAGIYPTTHPVLQGRNEEKR